MLHRNLLKSPSAKRTPLIDPFAPDDFLSARLRDRPLRFPLRLLHVRGHGVPAQGGPADASKSSTALCSAFIARGVAQAAADGRRAAGPARHHDPVRVRCRAILRSGALEELTLTTNGSQLAKYAAELKAHGVRAHQCLARHARSGQVPRASHAGAISRRCWPASTPHRPPGSKIKINAVALKGVNEDEIAAADRMGAWPRHGTHPRSRSCRWAMSRRRPRSINICRCRWCAAACVERFTLHDIDYRDRRPGALRAVLPKPAGALGFITPLTHNFCESLQPRAAHLHRHPLFMCLGQEDAADLRAPLRASEIRRLASTPRSKVPCRANRKGHDFIIDRRH